MLQSIPYVSSLLVSIVSAFPRLPSRIIGVMGDMPDDQVHQLSIEEPFLQTVENEVAVAEPRRRTTSGRGG